MAGIISSDWSENKQFKDPVYGYITVPRAYVKNLIDTHLMQRIKGVAQTGLRPVFSSATHDRFSHSLGVYQFGMKMYKSLSDKLYNYASDICCEKWKFTPECKKPFLQKLQCLLGHWNTLLAIACLLHDIGHPVQSHGFEFLYEDPFLDMEYEKGNVISLGKNMQCPEWERIYDVLIKVELRKEKKPVSRLSEALLQTFEANGDSQSSIRAENLPGKPHERMSAYYIFKDEALRNSIEELICASRKMFGLEDSPEQISQDLCFIARMIIGLEYPVEKQLAYNETAFFNSIKNCVIHILNGSIDADGIDYLMRNSYAAGYDTSRVDSTRLCNSYTAYEKNFVMFPAFSKSALSILEGYMSARNFEPKWLYSHHKVVYADLLTKQIYKYITRYWADRVMLSSSIQNFLGQAEEAAFFCDREQKLNKKLLLLPGEKQQKQPLNMKALRSHMQHCSYPFYTYLLAPCRAYDFCTRYVYQAADADMESMFRWMAGRCEEYWVLMKATGKDAYTLYKEELIQQTVDGIPDAEDIEIQLKHLRILLAENYLEKPERIKQKETLCSVLRKWAEDGNHATAIDAVHALGDEPKMIIEVARLGNDWRALLSYWMQEYQPLLSPNDFEDLTELLEEYQTRRYRSSLWKSYDEYRLFLKDCARQLGISTADVERYMVALIEDGMEERGISIYDGKPASSTPELYREQFYYLPPVPDKDRATAGALAALRVDIDPTVDERTTGKKVAQKWAKRIFSKTPSYNFSRNHLVAKFYLLKPKRFNNITLLFGERVVPLEDVFPYHKSGGRFPYFYYDGVSNASPVEIILKNFQNSFVQFCGEFRETEVRSEAVKKDAVHTFRDAVYGDIKMPDKYYAVVCTKEFQRLGRIRQLAAADRRFPNATHTRLAHSLGTWHIMRLILDHFEELYRTPENVFFTQEDRHCALLAALLHDLGHGPYSHLTEAAFQSDPESGSMPHHEEISCQILTDAHTEIHEAIQANFGENILRRVLHLLSERVNPESCDKIDLIYRSVISGQLDADRIDYLMRDNVVCGMAFGHIDFQQLIASMRFVPDYDGQTYNMRYRLCFDERYLPAIEQFIHARFRMYQNVYYDPQKLLFEEIYIQIFRKVFALEAAVRPDPTLDILKRLRERDFHVQDYLCLDDETVNMLIRKWVNGDILQQDITDTRLQQQARIIQKLAGAFLDQSMLFRRIDLGANSYQYDLLAKRIGRLLGKPCNTFKDLESSAFIYISGNDCAYQMHKKGNDEGKNIVLRNMDDGTTMDYAQRSMFRTGGDDQSILKTDYHYLYFSETLLEIECEMNKKIVEAVKQMVDLAQPRKHIEIENKFYCREEQLQKAENYLDQNYKDIKDPAKLQTDTYYDCKGDDGRWLLYCAQFSFRCRKKDGNYIFTVKIPTHSPNYQSPSQFARHEYEMISPDPNITENVWQFLTETLDICGNNELLLKLDREQMQPLLKLQNNRTTYRLDGKWEICLDTVDYTTADDTPVGNRNYQIEIESLGDPEDWLNVEKTVIAPLKEKLGEIQETNKSKLETGMDLQ